MRRLKPPAPRQMTTTRWARSSSPDSVHRCRPHCRTSANATQPIESIVPEDIGKMPDQNVAESLQRVPGVQINRAGGKGTQVLIHGLSNNLITLNGEVFLTGREFYVSGEASGGGVGGNVQYASLEGIPSEEIGGIDVIKNPTAANGEGGLGGIINLKTRSALAQKRRLQPRRQRAILGRRGHGRQRHPERHAGRRLQVQRRLRHHRERVVQRTGHGQQGIPGSEPQPVADHEFGAERQLCRFAGGGHAEHDPGLLHHPAARVLHRLRCRRSRPRAPPSVSSGGGRTTSRPR